MVSDAAASLARMVESADARQLVDRFVEAWLAGDLDAVMACVTDDVVFCPSGSGGVVTSRGIDEVRQVFAEGYCDSASKTQRDCSPGGRLSAAAAVFAAALGSTAGPAGGATLACGAADGPPCIGGT
jgi:hypothetical protein